MSLLNPKIGRWILEDWLFSLKSGIIVPDRNKKIAFFFNYKDRLFPFTKNLIY